MFMYKKFAALAAGFVAAVFISSATLCAEEPVFQQSFNLEHCRMMPWGINDTFMPLIPGYSLLLQGDVEDEGEIITETVHIKVLRRIKWVDGVRCAIVREKEWADGELVEVSHNYFAICRDHKGVFYFGEDVDDYEDGEIVGHGGAWLAGTDGAQAGLVMPGLPLIGSRYYQEVAPGIAEDRAEHLSVDAVADVPAGFFDNCLLVEETTPLDAEEMSFKFYARHIGLVKDDELELVDFGFCVNPTEYLEN
jgi:hypothetical protein